MHIRRKDIRKQKQEQIATHTIVKKPGFAIKIPMMLISCLCFIPFSLSLTETTSSLVISQHNLNKSNKSVKDFSKIQEDMGAITYTDNMTSIVDAIQAFLNINANERVVGEIRVALENFFNFPGTDQSVFLNWVQENFQETGQATNDNKTISYDFLTPKWLDGSHLGHIYKTRTISNYLSQIIYPKKLADFAIDLINTAVLGNMEHDYDIDEFTTKSIPYNSTTISASELFKKIANEPIYNADGTFNDQCAHFEGPSEGDDYILSLDKVADNLVPIQDSTYDKLCSSLAENWFDNPDQKVSEQEIEILEIWASLLFTKESASNIVNSF